MLTYIERESVDIWKKNLSENIKAGKVQFESARNFLAKLKKEFGESNNKLAKVTKLKKVDQILRTIKEFI